MGAIVGFVIFGIPSAIIAGNKGFKSFRWLFAFGLIGLIVVSSLSSAKGYGIPPDEAQRRTTKADTVGAWMCGINLGLGVIGLLFVLSSY